MTPDDRSYVDTLLAPIRVCADYKPKFGQGGDAGLGIAEFQTLYRSDAFYNWFGLDNPLMYAAHKAAGGMTSVYRQIGIGCEKLIRTILRDSLGLADDDVCWSYQVPTADAAKMRRLSLDGRIPLDKIEGKVAKQRVHGWMVEASRSLGIASSIANSLTGIVFEVRQGYKSKDSKRQNADIANAATAYTKAYLPCALIMSAQIDGDIMLRYRGQKWAILVGKVGTNDPQASTYDFMRLVVGYDLAAFFERNSKVLKKEIDVVLRRLLTPTS